MTSTLGDLFNTYPWLLSTILIVSILLGTFIIQKIIGLIIHRTFQKKDIARHAENATMLLIRIFLVILALSLILRVGGIPQDIIIAITTLTGTVLGLASSRSIGNIFAGLWVLITNPYHVGDYVNFGGGLEGIIEEINLNYTKITTPLNDSVLLSNQKVLDKEITNYRIKLENKTEKETASENVVKNNTKKGLSLSKVLKKKVEYGYRYPILLSFHTQMISTTKIHAIIENVLAKFASSFIESAKYEPFKRTHLEKGYAIYITVKDPQTLMEIVPKIMEDISIEVDNEKQ